MSRKIQLSFWGFHHFPSSIGTIWGIHRTSWSILAHIDQFPHKDIITYFSQVTFPIFPHKPMRFQKPSYIQSISSLGLRFLLQNVKTERIEICWMVSLFLSINNNGVILLVNLNEVNWRDLRVILLNVEGIRTEILIWSVAGVPDLRIAWNLMFRPYTLEISSRYSLITKRNGKNRRNRIILQTHLS